MAVGKSAGLFGHQGEVSSLDRILYLDAAATIAGSTAGTSTVMSYIESLAGVAARGRSGVTAIVTGLLFLAALFVALDGLGAEGTVCDSVCLFDKGGFRPSASKIPWVWAGPLPFGRGSKSIFRYRSRSVTRSVSV